jgi:hypothetical protein
MTYGPVNSSYPFASSYGTYSAGGASSPFSSPFAGTDSADTLSLSGHGEEKKSKGIMGAITDFGKGIFKGAVNTVSSLFSLKGLAMTLGAAALVAVAGPIAIPLLIAGGLAIGGKQIFQGVTTGNWEKAGEGTFTVGATLLGAKVGPKSFKGADGVEYALKGGDGFLSKPIGYLKSLIPGKMGKVYEATLPDGTVVAKSGLALGKESATHAFSGLGSKFKHSTEQLKKGAANLTEKVTGSKPQAKDGAPLSSTDPDLVQVKLTPDQTGQVKVDIQPTGASATEAPTAEVATAEAPKKSFFSKFVPKLDGAQTSGMVISSSMAGAMGDDGPGVPGLPGLTQHH